MFKYESVKQFLLEEMKQLEAGRRMPSVRSLSSRLHVSVATVLRALQELEQQKLIKRFQGSGTVALNPDSMDATELEKGDSARPVIIASVDWPNEFIWATNHALEYTLQDYGYLAANYRISQGMRVRDVCDFVKRWNHPCHGLVISGLIGRISQEEWRMLRQFPFRVALLDVSDIGNEAMMPDNCCLFINDPEQSAELVVDYLARRGHRSIGFLRNEPGVDFAVRQIRQIEKSARERGMSFDSSHVLSRPVHPFDNSLEIAHKIIQDNMERVRDLEITAIFGLSSYGIFAIVNPLREAGFRVPEDISLVGQGDFMLCKHLSPPLTVLNVDLTAKINRLVRWLDGEAMPSQHVLSQLELVERRSVADLSK